MFVNVTIMEQSTAVAKLHKYFVPYIILLILPFMQAVGKLPKNCGHLLKQKN